MYKHLLLLFLIFQCKISFAHPMPGSLVNLSILETSIKGEAKIPITELQNAIGEQQDYTDINSPFFIQYFLKHINANTGNKKWYTVIHSATTTDGIDSIVGKYKEVIVYFELIAPPNTSPRQFTFNYDVVIHQVITHQIFINVQQDWFNGLHHEQHKQQLGIIALDIPSGKYSPLHINLDQGSWWKGFYSIFTLGMQHIREGTDHILFLIVLLLPAMLVTNQKKWTNYGGLTYSLLKLLKIVTAFTVGHSITLLFGALNWVNIPQKPVEILIAFSILVSAVNAIMPIFFGKEIYLAAAFGLVHGLAFATVLSKLQLSTTKLALSILGFNLGIEFMQLFIISLIIPWLILLSKTPYYKWYKNALAFIATIAAIAWIVERTNERPNTVSTIMQYIFQYSPWAIAALAIIAIITFFWHQKKIQKTYS
jgi:hypothetical protein